MTKRKRKKGRRSPRSWVPRSQRRPTVDLSEPLERADRLIARDRPREAIALLEPLLDSYPRVADLHYLLGYAYVRAGEPWRGLVGYERALELSRDVAYWLPLAWLYLELDLDVHALYAFRQALKHQPDEPMVDAMREAVAGLEKDVQQAAADLGLPVAKTEKGLRFLEEGQRALNRGDFGDCIAANRRAIKLLADWPPPHNNLSLALFFDGQPDEAIATARLVLAQHPDNIQALSNAIRFLTWTGQETEARALWAQLQEITPQNESNRLKMAEAAAVLDRDRHVYELLEPLDDLEAPRVAMPGFSRQIQLYLAVAEANLGRRTARRRLEALRDSTPWADEWLAALKAGRPGPGWAERFPYFRSSDLISRHQMDEFVELVGHQGEMAAKKFRRQVERFVARFPQIVLVAEKLVWEELHPEVGVAMLSIIATPAAHAALRRFGLSQIGTDEDRLQALFSLMQAGEIAQSETLRVWHRGEWREMQLRQQEISDEYESPYTQKVADLLNQGLAAHQQSDDERAERLFRRAIELEPHAKEAYNNLGAVYARRGDHAQAQEMFRAAVEIDPLYAFPRCNLASYLLDDDDVEGAQAMLAPLAEATRFHPQDMAFYSYTQARVLMRKEEYDAARRALQTALEVWPDHEPSKKLLEHLDTYGLIMKNFQAFAEQRFKRDEAWRARLQAKLSTADPSLSEALSLYTKDALTGMAQVILPWDNWSGLRKAELLERVVKGLQDDLNLKDVVAGLEDEERTALRQVLAQGGRMLWGDFDAAHGNDLQESRYWNYHEPETLMGRLRLRGLLVEATVEGELLIVVPSELRRGLKAMLG